MGQLLLLAAALAALCYAYPYPYPALSGCVDLNAPVREVLTTGGPLHNDIMNVTLPHFPDAPDFTWEINYIYMLPPQGPLGPVFTEPNVYIFEVAIFCDSNVYELDNYNFPYNVNYTDYVKSPYQVIRTGGFSGLRCSSPVIVELGVTSWSDDPAWDSASFMVSVFFRYINPLVTGVKTLIL